MAEKAETRAIVPAARAAQQPAAELSGQSWLRRREQLLIGTVSVVVFLVLWHAADYVRDTWPDFALSLGPLTVFALSLGPLTLKIPPTLFLPGPLDVVDAFGELFREGKIWNDMLVSGQELVVGYGLAALVAVPLGLLMGWYRRLRYALDPFITFFYSTPRIVLLPLLIIWFGIGINSKIAIVFLGAFFAMVINTTAGVRNLDVNLLRVAHSFGASDLQIFRTIALPGSVPFILTGLRLGTGHALIGVVVGELVAAQAGVGQMMAIAGATFQTAKVFAGLMIIASAGLLLTYAIQAAERHFEAWRPQR